MRYKVNKRYPIIFSIMIVLICIVATALTLKYIHSISNRVCAISSYFSASVFGIVIYRQDLKASFTITDEYFNYIRGGIRAKVEWDSICRIEYSNVLKAKAFDCMIIYCGYGKLYIDYTVENYLELWELIIKRCEQQKDNITIDPKLYTILAKRLNKDI